ncbi:MAG: adenylate/guanylate cyclase domain-containing protein [Gaiellales bacterium]
MWSIHDVATTNVRSLELLLLIVLTIAAIACSRFPIQIGLRQSIISLDSIPLVMGVILLSPSDAVLMGIVTGVSTLIGQPSDPGWAGRFWRLQIPLASGLVMGLVSLVSSMLVHSEMPGVVLVVPAFFVALLLELAFDVIVLVEFEATEPGSGRSLLDALVVPAANVFLPAVSTAMLTPYIDEEPWQFALLLPVLLVGMYGALWIANSQQLEKRRGERLKDTFSRYVPEGVVDNNLESMQEIELGGEQHDVSVLFCDIRGFTSWSEDRGATEVITELNVLLTELSASVMGTDGTLDKFTGDGLMAFWGAPVPVEDHADRACRAALDMLVRLHAVNARRREDGQQPFAIGVAVHSGTAVVGNVGHERRLDYTAIGDTVNTAARLEASTKELGAVLLISRATVDELSDELRTRAMLVGDVTMRGKAHPVEAWALKPMRPELDDLDDEFAA